jgi:hypothetical protein
MPLSIGIKNKLLDHFIGGASYTRPNTLWYQTGYADSSNVNSYTANHVNSAGLFKVISGDFLPASGGLKWFAATLQITNPSIPTFSGSMQLDSFLMFDANTDVGSASFIGAFSIRSLVNVNSNEILIFNPGSISMGFD